MTCSVFNNHSKERISDYVLQELRRTIAEGAVFCHKCGTPVSTENANAGYGGAYAPPQHRIASTSMSIY